MKQYKQNKETQKKNYKALIVSYINQQKKDSTMKDMTNEKILTKMLQGSLMMMEDNQQYNTTIFDVIKESIWSYQVSKQILNKIINKNDRIQSILSSILLILDGYFNFNSKKINLIYVKVPYVLRYQSFFLLQSTENFTILFEVGLHKQYNDSKQQAQFCYFDIVQKITLLDIFFYQKGQEITDAIQEYQINNSKDFFRTALDQVECISMPLTGSNSKKQSYGWMIKNSLIIEIKIKLSVGMNHYTFHKVKIKFNGFPQSLNRLQRINRIFFLKNISQRNHFMKNYQINFIMKILGIKISISQYNFWILNLWVKFQIYFKNLNNLKLNYSSYLFEFIKLLSKYYQLQIKKNMNQKINLNVSNQERQIVTTKNNALVIGRSGTGKTTSIVLRIFATEMLVKVRSKLLGQKRIQFLQDYQGKDVQIHSLFSTANRFLVLEVEKYYHKLERQAQDAINNHRASKTFNLDESFVSINESVISNYECDVLDFILQEEQFQQFKNNEISQIEQQKLNEKSFLLTKFPSFLSTEQLLILLDQQSLNPFFSIEKIKKFRQKHCNKIGFQDFNGINLDEWFPQTNNVQYQSFSSNKILAKQDVMVPEVDFMLFYLQFWPQVCGRGRNNFDNIALPSLIWTQIYSYIKGSQYSYIYPNKCLPFQLYKERVENYLSETQIIEIYDCFLKYEIWKEKEQYIDQLDLINSLLLNLEQNQLNRFPIHYSYIDEVQDLPSAMIELFCKITEQGIIFCGDSAQSILKGVGFRFSDLQTIFKTSKKIGSNQLEKFQVYQLTKNFRSHNNILQLANQISNLKGPKPVIISKNDPALICFYLNQYYDAEEQCEIEFGYNQVIIVKNEEAKESLPQYFKAARVLTTYQTKGLEFDDVILYNCFSSDPIPEQQWAFLSCIDVDESYIDKQVYEESITKFDDQNNNYDIQLTEDGQQVIQKKLKLNQRYDKKKINDYSTLCNELKMLYVCITRAKKRVVIYDDDPQQRFHLEKILQQYQVCDFISNYDYQIPQKKKQFIIQHQVQQQENQQEYQKSLPKILDDEEKQMWESQGQLMFQKKLYDEAEKCFKKCKNERMAILSKAFIFATKGSQKLANFKSHKFLFKKKGTLDLKKKMDELELQLKQDFQQAIISFLDPKVNDLIQTAHCYYSGRMYKESTILYLNLELYPQAAKSAYKLKQIPLAIIIYYHLNDHINLLKLLSNYQQLDFQYGFFKYEFLKECLSKGLIKKNEVKQHLLDLFQDNQQNIFHLLVQKSKNIGNTIVNLNRFIQKYFLKDILDQVPILNLFSYEIKNILNSQIYIQDDLEEMVYTEFLIFWELYYEILDSQMIINQYSKQEIFLIIKSEQRIHKNQLLKQFLIEVLEQLNQHQVIITLYPEQYLYYQNFDQKKQLQVSLFVNPGDQNICQHFLSNQTSILQFLFLDEIDILRNTIIHQNQEQKLFYQELNYLLLRREQLLLIKDKNLFLIKSYYILSLYSQNFKNYQNYSKHCQKYNYQQYLKQYANLHFPQKFNFFFKLHLIIESDNDLNQKIYQSYLIYKIRKNNL